MDLTALLGLGKPLGSELVNVGVFNTNMDTLDNAVLLTAGQTLTNKTLTAPTISGPTITGGASVAGGLTVTNTGLTVTTGGLTVTAGGMTVTAGNVGIGVAPAPQQGLALQGSILSGNATQHSIVAQATASSAATGLVGGVYSQATTAAASFTTTSAVDFYAANPSKGAGSTITSAYGMFVESVTVGGTNNYGLYINAPSGASGDNMGAVIRGDVALGGSTAQLATTATSGFIYVDSCAGTPTGVPARYGGGEGSGNVPMVYDTTAHKIWFYVGSWRGVAVT